MKSRQRITLIYLRFVATMMLLALPFVFVPHDWMASINDRMGLVELPDLPIIRYLTRSASALYGMYGALLLFLSFDVNRYHPALRFLATTGILFGILVTGIDLQAGMPAEWTWREGPVVILESAVLLALLGRKRVDHPPATGALANPDA
ncbi:MAG: hypothetical protein RI897_1658 [Verrucomicrobiota bacterium]|jgi:hypothetical protein